MFSTSNKDCFDEIENTILGIKPSNVYSQNSAI